MTCRLFLPGFMIAHVHQCVPSKPVFISVCQNVLARPTCLVSMCVFAYQVSPSEHFFSLRKPACASLYGCTLVFVRANLLMFWVHARPMPQVAVCSVECESLHLFPPQGGAVHGQLAEPSRDRGLDRLDERWDIGTSRRHG